MKYSYFWIFFAIFFVTKLSAALIEPTLSIDLGNDSKLESVLVPKGSFLQGSPTRAPPRRIGRE